MTEANTEETKTASGYPDPRDAHPSGLTADRVARLVTELGVGWARYGITVGRLALRQSARALETTSDLLGELAQKIEKVSAPADGDTASKDTTENRA